MDEQAWRKRICARVREVRRQCGLSQLQFALAAGLSHHTVGKIERMEVFPDLGSLIRLSEAHKVPLAEFFVEESKPDGKKEKLLKDLTALLRRKTEPTIDLVSGLVRYLLPRL